MGTPARYCDRAHNPPPHPLKERLSDAPKQEQTNVQARREVEWRWNRRGTEDQVPVQEEENLRTEAESNKVKSPLFI